MQDSSYPLVAKAALAVTLPPRLPPYTVHPPSHSARRKRRAASLTQPRTTSLLLSVDPSSDSFVDQERVEAAELVAVRDLPFLRRVLLLCLLGLAHFVVILLWCIAVVFGCVCAEL